MNSKKKLSATFNNSLLIKPDRAIPTNIAVIGSGTIGPDIGYYLKSILPDSMLYLVDIDEQALRSAKKRIDKYIKKAVEYKKMKPEISDKLRENIIYTSQYRKIVDCELVIEAATEDIALKQNIFSKVEKLVGKKTIITSNTSSIPASRIFANMVDSDRTAVTHFFAPAWKSLPVEVVGWEGTNQKTVDFLCWFFAFTGKIPITTKDSVCFMLDRIFDNWCNEAAYLLCDASATQIDKIAEEFVYAGPFFVLNMAKGNPIIIETNSLQMEEGKHYKPAEIFKSVENWLTRRPGSDITVPDKIASKIRDRMLGIFFSQSFDIVDRGIGNLEDLNLGCELALGFRKGPIDLMKTIGPLEVERIVKKIEKERPGFPKSRHSFEYYQNFNRFILEDEIEGVKIITIRRPQALNALNDAVTNEILSVLRQYSDNVSIKGFIITGFGNKAFSAGADIGEFPKMLGNYEASVNYARECSQVQCFIDKMNKPVIAAINGVALGGGLEIAIRCHKIVASENAMFQFPEVSLGILPGIGGCVIPYRKWPHGANTFNDMIMLSRKLNVDEAYEIGMLDSVVKGYNSLITKAIEMVHQYRDKMKNDDKTKYNAKSIKIIEPEIRKLIKLNLSSETVSIIANTIQDAAMESNLNNALEIGYQGFGRSACTDSAKEGISAFMERRKPEYNK